MNAKILNQKFQTYLLLLAQLFQAIAQRHQVITQLLRAIGQRHQVMAQLLRAIAQRHHIIIIQLLLAIAQLLQVITQLLQSLAQLQLPPHQKENHFLDHLNIPVPKSKSRWRHILEQLQNTVIPTAVLQDRKIVLQELLHL